MSQTPRVKNPARGFVSSANQNSAGPGYPYYLGWDYAPWDRAHRINGQLARMHHATADSLRQLQNDDLGVNAQLMLPWMLFTLKGTKESDDCYSAPLPNSPASVAMRVLARWKYHYTADAIGATIFGALVPATDESPLGRQFRKGSDGSGNAPSFARPDQSTATLPIGRRC